MTPVLRYRNPGAAARWLCDAFGFREHESAQESDHHVKYILLRLGDSGVLVRPVANSVFDDLMVEPSAVGGGNTHVLYLPIPDAELHCERAKAAGAKVELEPQEDGLGGHFYTCRDPEGHLWSFGTKDYGLGAPPGVSTPLRGALAPTRPTPSGRHEKRSLFARGLAAVTLLGALAAGWMLYEAYTQGAFEAGTAMTTGAVERGQSASDRPAAGSRVSPQGVAGDAAVQLSEERSRRLAAEAAFAEATAKLGEEQARRLAAETRAADAEAHLSQTGATAAEARQAALALETEAARERREAKEALSAAEQRLAEQLAETARDKEAASKALRDAHQVLRDERAAGARAQAALEAVQAEAASERSRQAAAAIAASAEAAATRQQLAELEQEKGKQGTELEGAYTALKAIRAEIEALRAAQTEARREATAKPAAPVAAVEPQAPLAPRAEARRDAAAEPAAPVAAVEPQASSAPLAGAPPPAAARPPTPCAQAVQGKVRLGPSGSRVWPEGSLARLCHGAETSVEPARCFDELMRGKISWGTGSTWTVSNALILCAGTRNARQSLDCFATHIAGNETWASAINACRLAKQP
jgi:uncharacterized glyoxalase superfamily protein PhnB